MPSHLGHTRFELSATPGCRPKDSSTAGRSLQTGSSTPGLALYILSAWLGYYIFVLAPGLAYL